MKELIETLYPMNRCLLGEGMDNALAYLKTVLGLEIFEIPSGTKLGTWKVPDEWIVRDAWVKFNGEKLLDYKLQPLCLAIGSIPFSGKMNKEEFRKHVTFSDEMPTEFSYDYKFYNKDWGFTMPKITIKRENTEGKAEEGLSLDGKPFVPKEIDIMPEGEYEVFIDTEFRPGKLKYGVHTIKGKTDREILLFAHLDHPFQANDNLSAVACLAELSKDLGTGEHTVKLVFGPETIGSIAYAHQQDLSKVDFMIAVDICGNDNTILLQKSFEDGRLNRVGHLAIHSFGESYRKGAFRNTIGSDEYVFNDPLVGIPGLMLSTWPYPEYHTSADTPAKINYDMIKKVGNVVYKIIEIYEKDFIPERKFKGPLMRAKYGVQTDNKQLNLSLDYLIYSIDGKKYVSELAAEYGLNFDLVHQLLVKLEADNEIGRVNAGKVKVKKTTAKKSKRVSRKTDVPSEPGEVS